MINKINSCISMSKLCMCAHVLVKKARNVTCNEQTDRQAK